MSTLGAHTYVEYIKLLDEERVRFTKETARLTSEHEEVQTMDTSESASVDSSVPRPTFSQVLKQNLDIEAEHIEPSNIAL